MILAKELNTGQETSSNRKLVEIACSQGQAAQEVMGKIYGEYFTLEIGEEIWAGALR